MSHPPTYSHQERQRILLLARQSLVAALSGGRHEPEVRANEAFLHEQRGCFVTLRDAVGRLRGCIGNHAPHHPLAHAVVEMTGAATRDPRFVRHDPVRREEARRLVIEVSILTPMVRIEDPLAMRIGVDGIHIRGTRGGAAVTGCLLPQVATEQRWTAEQTVSYCCEHKMGLAAHAWRPPTPLEFHVFQSTIVSEDGGHV